MQHHAAVARKIHLSLLFSFPEPPLASDYDRQVAEVQVRVAILNGYIALGIPVTKALG